MNKLLGVVMVVLGLAAILPPVFSNPDMTEIRLMIEFWYLFIPGTACLVIGGILIDPNKY